MKTTKILTNPEFLKELEGALESGMDVDYIYDGEDEYPVDTFCKSTAMKEVIKVIEKYFNYD